MSSIISNSSSRTYSAKRISPHKQKRAALFGAALFRFVARDVLRQLALPIKLWCTGDVTPARIAARARVQMAQIGLKLLVIDYLNLVSSNDRHATIYERVTAVSREIKLISQTLNIPILLLAQLNREGAKGLPTLEHLRDSGAIEQDANNVWFLHREDRAARDCKLIVANNARAKSRRLIWSLTGPP